jgi:hypothetical protein
MKICKLTKLKETKSKKYLKMQQQIETLILQNNEINRNA